MKTDGLSCPDCGCQFSGVTDSRPAECALRRRRKCLSCGFRWTTYEMALSEQEVKNTLWKLSKLGRTLAEAIEAANRMEAALKDITAGRTSHWQEHLDDRGRQAGAG